MADTVLNGSRFLSSVRFKTIIETLASKLERQRPLVYLDWFKDVNADDNEIVGRFTGKVFAADIIADDQGAAVYDSGKIELVTTNIPNIKIGQKWDQAKLNLLNRLQAEKALVEEENAYLNWQDMLAENLLFGVRQRKNAICCAALLDSIVYDRLGIKINGSWGSPSDMKFTPTYPWTDHTNGDPLADIQDAKNYAALTYGKDLNHMILSSADLDEASACTKFHNRVSVLLGSNFKLDALSQLSNDRQAMKSLIERVANLTITLDDATFNQRTNEGKVQSYRYLPLGKVILCDAQDKGNSQVIDFANGVVTESLVGSLVADSVFSGPQYGPTGYFTGSPDLNPPNVTAWAVARGWARKHVPEANAVLTVR